MLLSPTTWILKARAYLRRRREQLSNLRGPKGN